MRGPRAEETGSASVLIEHKLVLLAGSASPAAAHLSFADHLETHTRRHTHTFTVKGLNAPAVLFCS